MQTVTNKYVSGRCSDLTPGFPQSDVASGIGFVTVCLMFAIVQLQEARLVSPKVGWLLL